MGGGGRGGITCEEAALRAEGASTGSTSMSAGGPPLSPVLSPTSLIPLWTSPHLWRMFTTCLALRLHQQPMRDFVSFAFHLRLERLSQKKLHFELGI